MAILKNVATSNFVTELTKALQKVMCGSMAIIYCGSIFFYNFGSHVKCLTCFGVINDKIPLNNSYISTQETDKFVVFLHTFPILSMLWSFLYLTITFRSGSLILLARGPYLLCLVMLRVLTILGKM